MERREALLQELARKPLAWLNRRWIRSTLAPAEDQLAEAQAQIAELRRQLFGPKAEKLSPDQQAQWTSWLPISGRKHKSPRR